MQVLETANYMTVTIFCEFVKGSGIFLHANQLGLLRCWELHSCLKTFYIYSSVYSNPMEGLQPLYTAFPELPKPCSGIVLWSKLFKEHLVSTTLLMTDASVGTVSAKPLTSSCIAAVLWVWQFICCKKNHLICEFCTKAYTIWILSVK